MDTFSTIYLTLVLISSYEALIWENMIRFNAIEVVQLDKPVRHTLSPLKWPSDIFLLYDTGAIAFSCTCFYQLTSKNFNAWALIEYSGGVIIQESEI